MDLKKPLAARARVSLVLVGCGALVGYTGGWHWLAELFAHFMVQYWIVSLLAAVVLLWAGDKRWGAAAAALCGVLSLALSSYYQPQRGALASMAGTPLKLLQFNAAQNPSAVVDWLGRNPGRADLVLLLEATPDFRPGIERLRPLFPFSVSRLDEGPFGIALLSKYPLTEAEVFYPVGEDFPALAAGISVDGWSAPLSFYGVHPPPPVSGGLAGLRDRFMVELARKVGHGALPTIVAGDVNSTPWAPGLRGFMDATSLRDCQRGQGLIATWPSATARYSPLFGIPIDACLISDRLHILTRQVGPDLASDHLPVVTELILK